MRYIAIFILVLLLQLQGMTQCRCSMADMAPWAPNITRSIDEAYLQDENDLFLNSINGAYVYEDKDSIYQLKIIVDAKGFATFVHVHHMQFYKYASMEKNKDNEKIIGCSYPGRVHDGGFYGKYVFTQPGNYWRRMYVASEFFSGSNSLKPYWEKAEWKLYKCPGTEERGIYLPVEGRFYKKIAWVPEGNFLMGSLITLLQKDLKPFNKEQLATLRNEIFARYNFRFDENGKWFPLFSKTISYRWNVIKDVEPFLTTIEKDNLQYIKAFEKNHYENQQENDFLDFWKKLSAAVLSEDVEKIYPFVKFPFYVKGSLDDIPALKVNKAQFKKVWPLLLHQENYYMTDKGKLTARRTRSVFSLEDPFAEQMIHITDNNIDNLNFEKINGQWMLTSAFADFDLYSKIEEIVSK